MSVTWLILVLHHENGVVSPAADRMAGQGTSVLGWSRPGGLGSNRVERVQTFGIQRGRHKQGTRTRGGAVSDLETAGDASVDSRRSERERHGACPEW